MSRCCGSLYVSLLRFVVAAGRREAGCAKPVALGPEELAALLLAEGPRQAALLPRDTRGELRAVLVHHAASSIKQSYRRALVVIHPICCRKVEAIKAQANADRGSLREFANVGTQKYTLFHVPPPPLSRAVHPDEGLRDSEFYAIFHGRMGDENG